MSRRICWLGTYEREYPRARVLISGLRAHGVQVDEIHSPAWDQALDNTKALGSPLAALRAGTGWIGAWARLVPQLKGLGGVDAIVAGYPAQPDAVPAWMVKRAVRAPLIVDMMISLADTLAGDRRLVGAAAGRVLAGVDRLTLSVADLVLTDTVAHADWMAERFGIPRRRFAVVPVGADPAAFPVTPQPPGPPSVLFYGKLAPLHGIQTIVEAARMPNMPPLHLIGKGQLDEWLARELRERPVPGLRHTPWVDYQELGGLVARASVCLGVFGTSEKAARVVPNKVFQAMAAGRPVVTADTPGVREAITDGREGLLVPAGDADALASALRKLVADPDLCQTMGAAARARYLEIGSPEQVGAAFLEGFARITQQRDGVQDG